MKLRVVIGCTTYPNGFPLACKRSVERLFASALEEDTKRSAMLGIKLVSVDSQSPCFSDDFNSKNPDWRSCGNKRHSTYDVPETYLCNSPA